MWKAIKVALFIWLAVAAFNAIRKCCSRRQRGGVARSATYSKIEEGQGGGADGAHANNVPYGSPTPAAPTLYGEGGVGFVPAGKFEPMGYAGATGVRASLDVSPLASPDPEGRGSASLAEQMARPVSPPSYSASTGQGAAAEYFAQAALDKPRDQSPQPSPGPVTVTFPRSLSHAEPSTSTNPFLMSATSYPEK